MEWKKSYQTFTTRRINDDVADKEANNADLEDRAGHVLGRYPTPKGDIYINLVFDDPSAGGDYAMIMYCEEY